MILEILETVDKLIIDGNSKTKAYYDASIKYNVKISTIQKWQNDKIKGKLWTEYDDMVLLNTILKYKGRCITEAYIEASQLLGKNRQSCGSRWNIVIKNKIINNEIDVEIDFNDYRKLKSTVNIKEKTKKIYKETTNIVKSKESKDVKVNGNEKKNHVGDISNVEADNLEENENRDGRYVYFIEEQSLGNIKIGVTDNIKTRISQLQTSSPYKLKLLHFIEGDYIKEKELHERFKKSRLNGEWFSPTVDLVRYIEELKIVIGDKFQCNVCNKTQKKGSYYLNGSIHILNGRACKKCINEFIGDEDCGQFFRIVSALSLLNKPFIKEVYNRCGQKWSKYITLVSSLPQYSNKDFEDSQFV